MANICKHYYVTGKVQGVWFRATAQEKARAHNLTGWVRNTYDSRVEITACGEEADLAEFETWLQKGPPGAHVNGVEENPLPERHFLDFDIKTD